MVNHSHRNHRKSLSDSTASCPDLRSFHNVHNTFFIDSVEQLSINVSDQGFSNDRLEIVPGDRRIIHGRHRSNVSLDSFCSNENFLDERLLEASPTSEAKRRHYENSWFGDVWSSVKSKFIKTSTYSRLDTNGASSYGLSGKYSRTRTRDENPDFSLLLFASIMYIVLFYFVFFVDTLELVRILLLLS